MMHGIRPTPKTQRHLLTRVAACLAACVAIASSALTPAAQAAHDADNVSILLKPEPVEGGIRLMSFDDYASLPQFHEDGEGFCSRCYFSSSIAGYEALRTRVLDPAYPIRLHELHVDDVFGQLPSNGCGTDGHRLAVTYYSSLTARPGRPRADPPSIYTAGGQVLVPPMGDGWETWEACLPPGSLSSDPTVADLRIGTLAHEDVYVREVTIYRWQDPAQALPSRPNMAVLHYPSLASDPHVQLFASPWFRACHSEGCSLDPDDTWYALAAGEPEPTPYRYFCDGPGGLSRANCQGLAQPALADLPMLLQERFFCPFPHGTCVCHSRLVDDDDVARFDDGEVHDQHVALLGWGDCTLFGFEQWSFKPPAEFDPGAPAIATVEYWDDPPSKLVSLQRFPEAKDHGELQRKVLFETREAGSGENAWRTVSILTDMRPHPSVSHDPHVALVGIEPAGELRHVKIRQVTYSLDHVELELPAGVRVGEPFTAWLRLRRADGSLATGLTTDGGCADVSFSFEGKPVYDPGAANQPEPVFTYPDATTCDFADGRCKLEGLVIDQPCAFTMDAILTYEGGCFPGLTSDLLVRSVATQHVVATARPDTAAPDIETLEARDGSLFVNGEPTVHSGWTTGMSGTPISSRWQQTDETGRYWKQRFPQYVPSLRMEATPGDWDPEADAFDGVSPLANRLQGLMSTVPLDDPGSGPILSADTNRDALHNIWTLARDIRAYNQHLHPVVALDATIKVPPWFAKRFGCEGRLIDCGRESPCEGMLCTVAEGENVFTRVTWTHSYLNAASGSPTYSLDPQACFEDHDCYEQGERVTFLHQGSAGFACWNDPNFQELYAVGMERLLMAFAADETMAKSLLRFQIENEPQFNGGTETCYCEDCMYEWWHWLKERYGTVANAEYDHHDQFGVSAQYGEWWKIEPPRSAAECDSDPHRTGRLRSGLCRDWALFRNDSLTRFFNRMAGTWRGHLEHRYPDVDRMPGFSAPFTSTTMTFFHDVSNGWAWPRLWEQLGANELATPDLLSGNNGFATHAPTLMSTMRDAFAEGKPYVAVEVVNEAGRWNEPLPAKLRRVKEYGAELLVSGLSGHVWIQHPQPGWGTSFSSQSVAEFRADPKWKMRNDIGRRHARQVLANQIRNGTRATMEASPLRKVAVLVSESSFAVRDDLTLGRATCDPFEYEMRETFRFGLSSLHKALYNMGGYDYTYLTETEVLNDPSVLDAYHAVLLTGFHGDDLGRSTIYSDCEALGPCINAGTPNPCDQPRCLMQQLECWLGDGDRTLVALWERPLETGSITGGGFDGPCWGLDRLTGIRYREPVDDPVTPLRLESSAIVHQAGASLPSTTCVPDHHGGDDYCWVELDYPWSDQTQYPCAWLSSPTTCIEVDPTANVQILLAPTQWTMSPPPPAPQKCTCHGYARCPIAPDCGSGANDFMASATRNLLPSGSAVYWLADGQEHLYVGPTQGICGTAMAASHVGRMLNLILRERGIFPTVDTHGHAHDPETEPPEGPAQDECAVAIRDLWKAFGVSQTGPSGERSVAVSLYNPYDYGFQNPEFQVPGIPETYCQGVGGCPAGIEDPDAEGCGCILGENTGWCLDADFSGADARDVAVHHLTPGACYQVWIDRGDGLTQHGPPIEAVAVSSTYPDEGRIVLAANDPDQRVDMAPGDLVVLRFDPQVTPCQ